MLDSRAWMTHQEPNVPDVGEWLRSIGGAGEAAEPELLPRRRGPGRPRLSSTPEAANVPVFDVDIPAANDDVYAQKSEGSTTWNGRRRRRRSFKAEEMQ